jgi:hypothetical protein
MKLFRVRVYVKPVSPASGMFGWLVVRGSPLSQFPDDWRRYGLRVALLNLWTEAGPDW